MAEPIKRLEFDDFPSLLKEINDPPEVLYARGTLPSHSDTDYKFLTVVGSRKNSQYGKESCERLIEGLRGQKIAIVSGLALGIDTIAHRSALRAGLPTIAVPGSGLDPKVLYPRSNFHLAEEIVSSGGALLSEYEPDFKATVWSFPRRNRIMAGLSHATLLIEAETKSGTMITAKLTSEYNRELLAVPGSIFSTTSEGPHLFLRIGATLVRSSEDILEALGIKVEEKEKIELLNLSQDEQIVVEILSEPIARDFLIQKLGWNISKANIVLSTMELKGLIKESLGEVHIV